MRVGTGQLQSYIQLSKQDCKAGLINPAFTVSIGLLGFRKAQTQPSYDQI